MLVSSESRLRADVLAQLKTALPGKNLYDLAKEHSVTIFKSGKLNKGWVGQTIEHVANLKTGNAQTRDGLDFELKSTSLVSRGGLWCPKETIKVTQLNPKAILEEEFETSALWTKLTSLIFVGCHHEGTDRCTVVHISAFDMTNPELTQNIRLFWEDVRHITGSGEIADNYKLGSSDDFIQLRPTGNGNQWSSCPVTGERFPIRAFYATKNLIRQILHIPE